ncbi:MAG: hypothetical protein NUV46_00530 [Nanoarchaeota archaeon]|nr:hypothetical protein [Nanoarchaeota archaeon]
MEIVNSKIRIGPGESLRIRNKTIGLNKFVNPVCNFSYFKSYFPYKHENLDLKNIKNLKDIFKEHIIIHKENGLENFIDKNNFADIFIQNGKPRILRFHYNLFRKSALSKPQIKSLEEKGYNINFFGTLFEKWGGTKTDNNFPRIIKLEDYNKLKILKGNMSELTLEDDFIYNRLKERLAGKKEPDITQFGGSILYFLNEKKNFIIPYIGECMSGPIMGIGSSEKKILYFGKENHE